VPFISVKVFVFAVIIIACIINELFLKRNLKDLSQLAMLL